MALVRRSSTRSARAGALDAADASAPETFTNDGKQCVGPLTLTTVELTVDASALPAAGEVRLLSGPSPVDHGSQFAVSTPFS